MSWTIIDIALRGGASTLFVALALVLWRDTGRQLVGRAGVALSLAAVCYLVLSTPGVTPPSRPWMLPLLVGSISLPVAFYVFAGAWFDDDFRLGRKHPAAPRIGPQQPGEHPQRCRLAAAVRADQPEKIAAMERERHAFDHAAPTIALAQSADRDDWLSGYRQQIRRA